MDDRDELDSICYAIDEDVLGWTIASRSSVPRLSGRADWTNGALLIPLAVDLLLFYSLKVMREMFSPDLAKPIL